MGVEVSPSWKGDAESRDVLQRQMFLGAADPLCSLKHQRPLKVSALPLPLPQLMSGSYNAFSPAGPQVLRPRAVWGKNANTASGLVQKQQIVELQ